MNVLFQRQLAPFKGPFKCIIKTCTIALKKFSCHSHWDYGYRGIVDLEDSFSVVEIQMNVSHEDPEGNLDHKYLF